MADNMRVKRETPPCGRMRGNMANEKQKCPMCGTKLKMVDGKMTCKNCGYYIRNPQTETNNQAPPQYNYASGQPNNANQGGVVVHPSPKNNSGSGPAIAIVIAVTACLVLGALMTIFFRHASELSGRTSPVADSSSTQRSSSGNPSSSNSLLDYLVSSMESEYYPASSSSAESGPAAENSSSSQTSDGAALTRRLPQSSFFIELAEAIWEKGYRTITAEEYASLTAIKIDTDEKTIDYQLNYGETLSLSFQNFSGAKLSDLNSFPGLEFVSIDDDLDKGDLDNLNYLTALYAENSINEYIDIIPHPENILELGIEDTFFTKSLAGLETFPNLEYLSVSYDDLEDISILTQFPNLRGLTLEDCESLTDYSPLMSLTNLEILGIASSQLKTIDFIKVMPNLTQLRIEDSKITSISALESCPNLVSLTLIDNYSIENDDYSIVGELTQLNDLTLCLGHNFNLPSFAKLTQLQQLTVENAEDSAPLTDAANLVHLSLTDCSWWDLEPLTAMPQLTSLIIEDSHLDTLEPLTRCQSLVALDLENTNVYSNIEYIFGIPTLTYLNLSECETGIDFANLPANDALQFLYLSKISIMQDPSFSSQERTTISLSAHYDMFENFPSLRELYMASTKIDSIEFVKYLPDLEYLDITNNNVTSLKPLESLTYFWCVKCGKNTILENVSEDSGILVDTSN